MAAMLSLALAEVGVYWLLLRATYENEWLGTVDIGYCIDTFA